MTVKLFDILKVILGNKTNVQDNVIVEYSFRILINGHEFATVMCTPKSLEYLTVGFLFSEGIITSFQDIETYEVDTLNHVVSVYTKEKDIYTYKGDNIEAKKFITTACGRQRSINYYIIGQLGMGDKKIRTDICYSSKDMFKLVNKFNKCSQLFLTTGGVHSCALADRNEFISFEEDVGRHNALDKVIGRALIEGINLDDKILLTTGRVSSEMATKVIKARIPYLVSRSAPTDLAIEAAIKHNLTLIGFARGEKMNIYTKSPSFNV